MTYLDANASAPLKKSVQSELTRTIQSGLFNPSSIHAHGRASRKLISQARERITASLGENLDPEQLIFCSSGSEANQTAIHSCFKNSQKKVWITTEIEHDSVLQMQPILESSGIEVRKLPTRKNGQWEWEAIRELWSPEVGLVSTVWVNNETGVISEIEKLASFLAEKGTPLHVDAAQAWGKLPIDVNALPIRYLTLSSHKIGAPAGCGMIWKANGAPYESLLPGKQERGRRGGTEGLLSILAAGVAADEIDPEGFSRQLAPLRDRMENAISSVISDVTVNGSTAPRVANTSNLSFGELGGDGLVMALDLEGYSVSAGSACASGVLEPSHVLMAMGLGKLEAMSSIRVSLHSDIKWGELEGFVKALERAVSRVRKASRHEQYTNYQFYRSEEPRSPGR